MLQMPRPSSPTLASRDVDVRSWLLDMFVGLLGAATKELLPGLELAVETARALREVGCVGDRDEGEEGEEGERHGAAGKESYLLTVAV